MKIICDCGRENHYEQPFNDFRVQRIPCTKACRQAKGQTQEQVLRELEDKSNQPLMTPGLLIRFAAH